MRMHPPRIPKPHPRTLEGHPEKRKEQPRNMEHQIWGSGVSLCWCSCLSAEYVYTCVQVVHKCLCRVDLHHNFKYSSNGFPGHPDLVNKSEQHHKQSFRIMHKQNIPHNFENRFLVCPSRHLDSHQMLLHSFPQSIWVELGTVSYEIIEVVHPEPLN